VALGTHSQQQKTGRRGGFVQAGTIFSAQSAWCLWVGKLHHFWWWTVSEVNWLCRQAGQVNNQSINLDVYGLCSKQSSLFSIYALPSGGKSKDGVVH